MLFWMQELSRMMNQANTVEGHIDKDTFRIVYHR